MARILIIGGGAVVPALAGALENEGYVVSAAAKAERGALEHVAIVCWLERSSPERFLLGAIDSSMRGLICQAGAWERSVLQTAARNSIPVAVLTVDPSDERGWRAQALSAVRGLLEGP
jgi:hypothetical protein